MSNYKYCINESGVAEPHHLYAAPVLAAPALNPAASAPDPAAPAWFPYPQLRLLSHHIAIELRLKQTKVNLRVGGNFVF
jgi:hypothetical protein